MNRIIKGLGIALGCVLIASSCSEISFGDKFLGDQPESSGATTEEMFSSKINAEKVLTKAYTGLPYGLPTGSDYKLGVNILESITDLCYSFRDNISDGPVKLYYNGALSANNVPKNSAYRYGSKSDWTTIRYAWLYIENVEKVPDMTASEKSERIAEAKVLISLCYFEMLRYVGGVTWLDHYVDVNETMNFPRITFAETVEKIVGLLNEAINSNLAWKAEKADDGRMNPGRSDGIKVQGIAMGSQSDFQLKHQMASGSRRIYLLRKLQRPTMERCRRSRRSLFHRITKTARIRTDSTYGRDAPGKTSGLSSVLLQPRRNRNINLYPSRIWLRCSQQLYRPTLLQRPYIELCRYVSVGRRN